MTAAGAVSMEAASTAAVVLLVVATGGLTTVHSATPFQHSWGTVGELMAMHGKWKTTPPAQDDLAFAANNYATITTGTGCSATVNTTHTIEQAVQATAAGLKAANPSVPVGMYWRSGFALELAGCSGFAGEWAAHPEWYLKDDAGKVVTRGKDYYYDYVQADVREFVATVLVNATRATMASGAPLIDFLYIDGVDDPSQPRSYAPGVGLARSAQLVAAKYAVLADVVNQLDAAGHNQKLVLNGLDTAEAAPFHVATGASGSMFDHWSILQFLNRSSPVGVFNASYMDGAITLATSTVLDNVTTQIKGWPGPIIAQRDKYPRGLHTPTTPAELQAVALARFNSELALFLLVASEYNFWIYSWFWDFDDYVPGKPDSSIPAGFFPEAKCALGAPTGPYKRVTGTYTYTREFAHASVFVDLTNRTASSVAFDNCAPSSE